MFPLRAPLALSSLALALALASCASESATGGEGGQGGDSSATSGHTGGHGCFSTEQTCNGKCVRVDSDAEHCGTCGNICSSGLCSKGACLYPCGGGFVDDPAKCLNLYGAHEAYPSECPGCSTANMVTGACACPVPSTPLGLDVQSDCPGMPLRSATKLALCVTPALSAESDFGGAYQMDDLDGWCGANARCRFGNPLAGGACTCPAGFDDTTSVRSILRLPCNGSEGGSTIVFCGNKEAPLRSFGGAYQTDDVDPVCRVGNPWTGGCSCPAGTNDKTYRVMVDGAAGLYGSTLHLCLP